MAFVLKVKSLGSKPQNRRKKGLFWAIFRSILGENMAFFVKSRRKLRTKNFEAHFHRKLRTLEKCSNVKKLRTTESQLIFTGSYKKKVYYSIFSFSYFTFFFLSFFIILHLFFHHSFWFRPSLCSFILLKMFYFSVFIIFISFPSCFSSWRVQKIMSFMSSPQCMSEI